MRKRKLHILFLLLLLIAAAAGCGEQKKRITDGSEVYTKRKNINVQENLDTEKESQGQNQEVLYAVTGIDTERKLLTLRDCDTAKEKPYIYTGGTFIKNKYGDQLTIEQVSLGELVCITEKEEKLTEVQFSKDIFSYDDLYKYTLDKEQKSLMVGNESYYFDENILVFHEGSKISVSEISEDDMICMKGMGQHIYVIQVISGHGTVVLENTELFHGGYITIGNILSKKITPEMRIEVPEGTYLLAVANNGYGGSREITVEANRELKVNLDELKGEGPKTCQIKFKVTPENAVVQLDGEEVDLSQPVQVNYGVHQLTAKADGYAGWKRKLIVNSSTAEISIEMNSQEDENKDETISTSGNNKENNKTSSDNNQNNNQNNTNSNQNNTNTRNNTNQNNNNNNQNSTNNNRNNTNQNNNNNQSNTNNNRNNTNQSNNNNQNNNNQNNTNNNRNNASQNNNNNNQNNNNQNNNNNGSSGSQDENADTGSGRIDGSME